MPTTRTVTYRGYVITGHAEATYGIYKDGKLAGDANYVKDAKAWVDMVIEEEQERQASLHAVKPPSA